LKILVQTKEQLMKVPSAEKIAPGVAKCHALRNTGRVMKKAITMRYKSVNSSSEQQTNQ
jgi:hypothetical protein